MAFRLRASHLIAFAIAAGLGVWMARAELQIGGESDAGEAPPIAEREAESSSELFKVRFVPLMPEERRDTLLIRGRTEADATIPVRAETGGILRTRMVDKGDRVVAGDLVCDIDTGSREAKVAQAQAQLEQAISDYDANRDLREKGFASEAKLNQMNAALKAARAVVAEAELDLERTKVRAKASGIVQDPIAEPGDMLNPGGVCVTLINPDPMLFIGQVSERQIGELAVGMTAEVELVTGQRIEGETVYIATSADAQTRTFRTEIRIPNPSGAIRDGLTANARVKLAPVSAFRISPSWITLADNGAIGLRIADEEDVVRFVAIDIIAQGKDGFWVLGPEPGMRVITLGQEYVIAGESIDATLDDELVAAMRSGNALNGAVSQ